LFNSQYFLDSVFWLDNNIAKYKLENFKPDKIRKVYMLKTKNKK
jgi:hypothetical protein